MVLKKENFKDWKIWYKLFFGSFVFIFIIKVYIETLVKIKNGSSDIDVANQWAVYNDAGKILGYDYLACSINYISFFTNQSNILVGFWFIFGVIYHNKEGQGKVLGRTFSLATTVYITVTGLVFNFMLLPTANFSTLTGNWWVNQISLHTIMPLSMIIYFCVFSRQTYDFSFKSYVKQDFWKFLFYPIAYLILSLIRGEMIYRAHGNVTTPYAYPYFFLQIHGAAEGGKDLPFGLPGFVWLLLAVIIILSIIFGFGLLYSFINWKVRSNKK